MYRTCTGCTWVAEQLDIIIFNYLRKLPLLLIQRHLANFGIYHTSALMVVVSNQVQEVGDIEAAMSNLLASRITSGSVNAPRSSSSATEPEPELE